MSKTNMKMTMLVSGTAAFSESEKKGKSVGFTPKASGNKMLTGFSGDAYLTTAPNSQARQKQVARHQADESRLSDAHQRRCCAADYQDLPSGGARCGKDPHQ